MSSGPDRPAPKTTEKGAMQRLARSTTRLDLFGGLSQSDIEEITAGLERRIFRAGEPIAGPGTPPDHVYLIKEGTVRLYGRGADGREVTVELMGRGHLFETSALFEAKRAMLLAEAATDVEVCIARRQDLLQVLSRRPQTLVNLVMQLTLRVLQLEQRRDRVGATDARARLVVELCRLVEESGEEALAGGRRIGEKLTHERLARQIGCSRETVTRLLTRLETEGAIRRDGRWIVVTQPRLLGAAVGSVGEIDAASAWRIRA
jgi:CRP-like cAMP-binding protein